ncbi:MAG: hypothetical protein FD123_3619, partial [Bacteroidetes bacterium]
EICEIIGRIVGKTPVFTIDEKTEPKHLFGDIGKMKRLLGEPALTFEEGVKQLV